MLRRLPAGTWAGERGVQGSSGLLSGGAETSPELGPGRRGRLEEVLRPV